MKNKFLKIMVPVLFSALFLSTAYAKPRSPIPVAPKGSITQQTPTYKWKAVSGATYYYLWSLDSSENLLFDGISASEAGCEEESKECSYKHSKKLSYGKGRWHVIAWDKEWGSWSSASHYDVKKKPKDELAFNKEQRLIADQYDVKKKPKDELAFNKEQRLIADQFISIFENGTTEIKYDYAKDIDDGRGITAGRAGFTSATGDMLIVIEKYTELKPDNSLAQYQDELRKLEKLRYDSDGKTDDEREKDRIASGSTENLDGLIEEWKDNAQSQDFRDIQDQVVSKLYYKPALKKAKDLGLKLPLSLLSLYDSNIMHGESGLDDLIKEATKMTDDLTPKEGADEITWLINFNHNRRDVLIEAGFPWDGAVERITELEDLIEEENTHLAPFEMIIEAYDNEKHVLPTLPNEDSD